MRTFNFPSSSLYLSIKSAGSYCDPHQSSISFQLANQHTSERVRARVNKLTREHSSCRSLTTSHYSQKSTSPRALKGIQVSAPLPRKLWHVRTIKLSVPLQTKGSESRSSKQKTHLSSLLTGPLCPASGDFA